MRSRIGYIIINLSYLLFALDIYLFNKIAEKYVYLCAICLVLTVFILFLGIYLVHPKKQMIMKTNTKFDKVLQFIAVIPFVIILALPFIILEIISFIFLTKSPLFKRQSL